MHFKRYVFENLSSFESECTSKVIEEFTQQLGQAEMNSELKNVFEKLKRSVDSIELENIDLHNKNCELLHKIKLLMESGAPELSQTMSPSQTRQLQDEIKLFDKIGSLNLAKIQASDLVNIQRKGLQDYLQTTREKVAKNCPLLSSLLKAMVAGGTNTQDNNEKTSDYKFKEALPVLSFITHIRSQKSLSDFPTLFGLLLIANGGSKSILTLLSSIGLCKSYEW